MSFGLNVGDHLAVATTLCSVVRDSYAPVVIDHASLDADCCAHPTPKMYRFESYIAVPIFRPGGAYFGNVCALDSAPALMRNEKTVAMITLFAELIQRRAAQHGGDADRRRGARQRERSRHRRAERG